MMLIYKRVLLLSVCLAILGSFVTSAPAQQSATATLSGAVKDPNGALVAGVQVMVTQKATGIKRQTVTNDVGFFVITNLAAGVYELKVGSKGFADNVIPSVTLQVGQTFDIEVPLAVTVQIPTSKSGSKVRNAGLIYLLDGNGCGVGLGEGAGFAKTIGADEITPLPCSTVIDWFAFSSLIVSFCPPGQTISKLKVLPSSGAPKPNTSGNSLCEQ